MQTVESEHITSDEQLAAAVARHPQSPAARREAEEAFGQLHARHARALAAFVSARIGRSERDDVLQVVWQRVWHKLPAGIASGSFRGWAFEIARNYLIDLARKRKHDSLVDGDSHADPQGESLLDELVEEERMAILGRCLQRLDDSAAQLVRARLAGEGYETYCARYELPIPQAHKLFHQAKQQLQICVERALR